MTKTCGECKHLNRDLAFCRACGAKWINIKDGTNCKYFEQIQPPTNGDRIRQGGDDELIDFADGIRRRMCHYCVYSKDKSCVDKTGNCWEGVRAWLNAPADCVKQKGDHDTQADLCKADKTESEGEDE